MVERGDRIALLGSNGAGKTTLLKIICGIDKEYSGSIELDQALKIGYFSQEFERLGDQASVLDSMTTKQISLENIRLLLGCLLFRKDEVFKKIANLSMGEKSRVAFAKLILCGANLLVLDEPTNYLDIASTERIEQVLCNYTGSVLLVSHDKYLVQRVANKIVFLEEQMLTFYDGGYAYYMQKSKDKEKLLDANN